MRNISNTIKRNSKLFIASIYNLQKILFFICQHPLSKRHKAQGLFKFLSWQISQFLSPKLKKITWVNGIKIVVRKGMTGITGSIYVGLHEFEDMGFVLHYVDKNVYFLDVGANVGCYSLLAASKGAEVFSFEPDKTSISALNLNKLVNGFDNITVINKAVGNEIGTVKFSEKLDTVNHVLQDVDTNGTIVSIVSLDSIDLDDRPIVMKIDVEGYEEHVLDGAMNYLQNSVSVVIVETNNSNLNYGSTNNDIFKKLRKLGFEGFTYNPFTRALCNVGPDRVGNTIFIKDPTAVTKQLIDANKFFSMSELI